MMHWNMAYRSPGASDFFLVVIAVGAFLLTQSGTGCQKQPEQYNNFSVQFPSNNSSLIHRVKRKTSNGIFFPIAMYTVRHHRPINDRDTRTVRPESWEYRGQYFYGFRPRPDSSRRRTARLLAAGLPLLLAPLLSILFSFPVVIPVAQMTTVTSAGFHPTQQYGVGRSGREKRRVASPEREARMRELEVVSNYLHQVDYDERQQSRVMVNYLQCNGLLSSDDHCLERLSCEFADPANENAPELEKTVTSILLGHMLNNEFLPKPFIKRLKSAAVHGRTNTGKCNKFYCHYVDNNWDFASTYPPQPPGHVPPIGHGMPTPGKG